jgi:hypothetical protein
VGYRYNSCPVCGAYCDWNHGHNCHAKGRYVRSGNEILGWCVLLGPVLIFPAIMLLVTIANHPWIFWVGIAIVATVILLKNRKNLWR